jgi:hypothetical protein
MSNAEGTPILKINGINWCQKGSKETLCSLNRVGEAIPTPKWFNSSARKIRKVEIIKTVSYCRHRIFITVMFLQE